MAFRTDAGGIAFACRDVKLQSNASTWATKLSQLSRQTGVVRIMTYSLPTMAYVCTQPGRRSQDICVIAHAKFLARAQEITHLFPAIRVAVHDAVHSKVLLIAPQTVIISSANFGTSHWHETSVSFHAKDAHDWYVDKVFDPLWDAYKEVEIFPRHSRVIYVVLYILL